MKVVFCERKERNKITNKDWLHRQTRYFMIINKLRLHAGRAAGWLAGYDTIRNETNIYV